MTKNINLPQSKEGGNVQVYGVDDTSISTGTIGAVADRQAIPIGSDLIELSLEADVFIAFGGSTITADSTSRVLFRGTHLYFLCKDQTNVSVLQLTGADTGTWTIAKLV